MQEQLIADQMAIFHIDTSLHMPVVRSSDLSK